MEITICSPEKDSLEIIIGALSNKGFECSKIYSKKKYLLFGKVTYCADLVSMEITSQFAPGGVSTGGFVFPPDTMGLNFYPGFFERLNSIPGIDAFKAGKNLRDILLTRNNEAVPSQIQYLETLEQKYVQCEDFEKAAETRDKISQLKDQNK